MNEEKTTKLILETWDIIEESEPDKSTEYLMARVEEDMYWIHGIKVDAGDISEALAEREEE
jgi:hypothetical protein